MATNRSIDLALFRTRECAHECPVETIDRVVVELPGKMTMRPIVLGRHHHAAGSAIESMDDSRTQHAAHSR